MFAHCPQRSGTNLSALRRHARDVFREQANVIGPGGLRSGSNLSQGHSSVDAVSSCSLAVEGLKLRSLEAPQTLKIAKEASFILVIHSESSDLWSRQTTS